MGYGSCLKNRKLSILRNAAGYGLPQSKIDNYKKIEVLGANIREINSPNKIQPGEYSTGSAADGILCNFGCLARQYPVCQRQ